VVLGRNWTAVVYKYDLELDDVLQFKIKTFSLKMNMYKWKSFSAKTYVSPDNV
jgi:hypothetical protein